MDYVELYQRRPGILTVACGNVGTLLTHSTIGRNRTLGEPTGVAREEIACQRQGEGGTSSLWLGLADLEAVRVDALAAVVDISTGRVLIDAKAVVLLVDADIANLFVARRRAGLGDGLLGLGRRLGRRLGLLEELLKLGVLLAGLVELVEELRHILSRHVGRHDVENLLVDVQ